MKTLEVNIKESKKLYELIDELYPDSSKTKRKEILARRVVIDSRRITQYDFPLHAGMTVIIEGDENRRKLMMGKMPIVYEDHYLLVVDKPAGLLSNSTHPNDITVISELNNYFISRRSRQRAHIVHRRKRAGGVRGRSVRREPEAPYERPLQYPRPLPHDAPSRLWRGHGAVRLALYEDIPLRGENERARRLQFHAPRHCGDGEVRHGRFH